MIAGHEQVCRAGCSFGDHAGVRGIQALDGDRRGCNNRRLASQEGLGFLHDLLGQPKLLGQDATQLAQQCLPDHVGALGHDGLVDVGAEPAGGDGAHDDVGIEVDPQDTSRNTSSSVR